MPTIEERALALVNEVKGCEKWETVKVHDLVPAEALFASIENLDAERAAHAQFRQEVSDAVRQYERELDGGAGDFTKLRRFILPNPDPLVEAVREAMDADNETNVQFADDLRSALAKRGGRIVFEEVGDAD